MSWPLFGIRIVEIGNCTAGLVCAVILADFGAEVIRIETEASSSSDHDVCLRGMNRVALDIHSKAFIELLKSSDVLIEAINGSTVIPESISAAIKANCPDLIHTYVSPYGHAGPYMAHMGDDGTVQAEAGYVSISGFPGDDIGVRSGGDIAFHFGGMMAAIGTLMALIDAGRGGQARELDVSMMDSLLYGLENQYSLYLKTGDIPGKRGNRYALSAPVGDFTCKDGQKIMISVATDSQWQNFAHVLDAEEWLDDPDYATIALRLINHEKLERDVERAFQKYTIEEAEARLQSKSCIYGRINDFKAVSEHPQVQHRKIIVEMTNADGEKFLAPRNPIIENPDAYRIAPVGTGFALNNISKTKNIYEGEKAKLSKPLEGFRILDFSQFMSGPMCTLMLSDFGAEVIKIENPPIGDNTRYGNVIDNNVSSHFATRNRGKKSIVLNMKDEEHKKLFLELVKTADAVIENYKPGTMEKFGISYEVLEKINPKIVFTSISGYGQSGPYASHAAFDQTVQAESGIMSITGPEGGEPVKCGGSIADYSGGLMACIGTLMGMLEAQRTGHGRRIDVSMMDSLIFCMENQFSSYLRSHKVPKPSGNSYASSAPIGAYKCKDGKSLMITVGTDAQWKTFCEALNQPQWFANENWATMTQRAADYKAIDAEVNKLFSQYDSDEVAEMLFKGKCVYGKINDFEAVANHPQVAYRKTIVNATYPNGVTFRVPGNPVQMSGMERETEYATAPLGYHTFEVLKEVADEDTLHRIFDPVMKQVDEATKAIYAKSK